MDRREPLRISLLGEFTVFLGEKCISRFETAKTRALLAYLAMEHPQIQRKEVLADLFWEEMPPSNALRNLRLTLHRLKSAITAGSSNDLPLFSSAYNVVQLDPNLPVWVDAIEFERILTTCQSHAHENIFTCATCAGQIAQAVQLYHGNFLDSLAVNASVRFEEWGAIYREKFFRMMVDALTDLGRFHLHKSMLLPAKAGRLAACESALSYARHALEMEPWHEPAHQIIMEALAQTDRGTEAVAQYRACCRVLAEEFNLEPGPATTQLYQKITTPKVNGALLNQPLKGNILLPPTPFIDRQMQVDKLRKLLFLYRWITLVGEGGIGKTRLAQHVTQGLEDYFEGGIWMIPLENSTAEFRSRDALHAELSRALLAHIPFLSGSKEMLPARIISQIGSTNMLLILDGFEPFSDGADFILDLLTNAPNLRVIVTTRHMIYFQAGYVMRVDGLPVPENANAPDALQSTAVELFIERAERCGCAIPLHPENITQIVRICRLLGGVPLAIELAAPLAIRFSLEKIAAALEQDISLLSSRFSDFPKRHSSMETVFESSWKFLTPQEQALLSLCAELPPEFTTAELQVREPYTQDEIDQLADKSLLARVSPGKYHMHQTLRLFVKSKNCLAIQGDYAKSARVETSPSNLLE